MGIDADQRQQIQRLLDDINEVGHDLLKNSDRSAQAKLSDLASRLSIVVQDPADALVKLQYRPYQSAVIRTCIALDVFKAVPIDGNISIQNLARLSECDEDLLRRLMRQLPPIGIFENCGVDQYRHSPLSRLFVKESQAAFFNLIFGELSTLTQMPEFYHQTAYGIRKENVPYRNPWQFANATTKPFFEWLQTQPEKLATFNLAMPGFSEQHNQVSLTYPFEETLQVAQSDSKEGQVAIVDVGGGNGRVLEQILETHPSLKGRMIVQDLAYMLVTTDVSTSRIEFMAHDFFEPQPIKGTVKTLQSILNDLNTAFNSAAKLKTVIIPGAQIYFFSHVFHDWTDEDCHRFLKPTIEAMDPESSRIVISDMVIDDANPTEQEALMDLVMMTGGGVERSKTQWKQLLSSAGLGAFKFWKTADGSVIEAMIN